MQTDLRVIFVGNSQVGKTALMNRFIDGEFTPTTQTTVNPIFTPKVVESTNGTEITMQLWDTAGQEKYQALSQVFYRGSHVAAICYEVSDASSKDAIPMWKERILNHEPGCAVILVATKIDLIESSERMNACEVASHAAAEHGIASYFITSAKTGEGVDDLFRHIATIGEEVLNKAQKQEEPPSSVNLQPKDSQKKSDRQNCPC
jgi:small GTP-binding protein